MDIRTSPEIWISEVENWRRLQASQNIRNALDVFDIFSVDAFSNVIQFYV